MCNILKLCCCDVTASGVMVSVAELLWLNSQRTGVDGGMEVHMCVWYNNLY